MTQVSPLYREIASILQAIENCQNSGNAEWLERWQNRLNYIAKNYLPSGSGFDSGASMDDDSCSTDKLVFDVSFHHVNGNGFYDGWTEHKVIVTPCFSGINLRVTGKNKNDIKDYIAEVFYETLTREYALTADFYGESEG
ncbi:MAG: hypothetical protein KGI54_16130 [Pseudomonadota bacterium]|nr:hypothetical protein [Pseudomonadota bacterium]